MTADVFVAIDSLGRTFLTAEAAIAIIEARINLYKDIGQINALRECVSSIRSEIRKIA